MIDTERRKANAAHMIPCKKCGHTVHEEHEAAVWCNHCGYRIELEWPWPKDKRDPWVVAMGRRADDQA